MHLEIERKFLVAGEFRDQAYNCTHIQQGYISSSGGRTVRVRIRDDRGYLTIKGPSGKAGLSRYEFETEIALSDAQDLMRICEPGIIDKIRWIVPAGKHVYEVDEFFGENAGLTVAEIELSAEDEPYLRLPFIGEEVTGDRKYYNSQLRQRPYSTWNE